MDHLPGIPADFHNADPRGRVRPNRDDTGKALFRQQVALRDGPRLAVHARLAE